MNRIIGSAALSIFDGSNLTKVPDQIEYRVEAGNTLANFLITTDDDFLEINGQKYYFRNRFSYDKDDLANDISKIINGSGVSATMSESGVLEFTGNNSFNIDDASQRAKILVGLFDKKFPIAAYEDDTYRALEAPVTTYGNVLYLSSIQGTVMISRLYQREYLLPVIYRLNAFMKPGLPIIVNKKGDKIRCNVEAAKRTKITVLDWMFEPVLLKSPMFIGLKLKPIF